MSQPELVWSWESVDLQITIESEGLSNCIPGSQLPNIGLYTSRINLNYLFKKQGQNLIKLRMKNLSTERTRGFLPRFFGSNKGILLEEEALNGIIKLIRIMSNHLFEEELSLYLNEPEDGFDETYLAWKPGVITFKEKDGHRPKKDIQSFKLGFEKLSCDEIKNKIVSLKDQKLAMTKKGVSKPLKMGSILDEMYKEMMEDSKLVVMLPTTDDFNQLAKQLKFHPQESVIRRRLKKLNSNDESIIIPLPNGGIKSTTKNNDYYNKTKGNILKNSLGLGSGKVLPLVKSYAQTPKNR